MIRYDERLILQHLRHSSNHSPRQFRKKFKFEFFFKKRNGNTKTENPENLKEKDNVETNRACVDVHDIDDILNVNTIV